MNELTGIIIGLAILVSPFVLAFLWIVLEDMLEKIEFERFLDEAVEG